MKTFGRKKTFWVHLLVLPNVDTMRLTFLAVFLVERARYLDDHREGYESGAKTKTRDTSWM